MTAKRAAARAIGLILLIASVSCDPPDADVLKGDLTKVSALDCPSALAAARKSGMPAPLLVLIEPDIWKMVVGSDTPAFALYEDGRTIYRTRSGYESVTLDPEELTKFLKSLDLRSVAGLAGGYIATERTHQRQTFLLIYTGQDPVFISVYGAFEQHQNRAKLPPEIAALRDKLLSFGDDRASQWLPEDIEVMIWPYDYAPEPSIVWPERWPDLDAPTTRKRGDSFSLYVPSAEFEPLKAFLASRREKGAVEIAGKKWAASFRMPFPHERLWMTPKGC